MKGFTQNFNILYVELNTIFYHSQPNLFENINLLTCTLLAYFYLISNVYKLRWLY